MPLALGVKVGRDRGTTILTVNDIERVGVDKTIEIALEVAWKGGEGPLSICRSTSTRFDAAFVPGTGWPEPGGLLPRESAPKIVSGIGSGTSAMEVCEVSPPYDLSDITALLGVRAIADVLATLIDAGHLGERIEE